LAAEMTSMAFTGIPEWTLLIDPDTERQDKIKYLD
jgi:hypothetical protein